MPLLNTEMIRISDDMFKEISQNLAVKIVPPIDLTGKCSVIGKYVEDKIYQLTAEEEKEARGLEFAICKQNDECDCPICV